MDVLMNGLLLAATVFAGGYCWVLARRVHALKSLDTGLGGAIVTLTRQIELARSTLDEAKTSASTAHGDLSELLAKAEAVSGQLKLSLAATRLAGADRPEPDPEPEIDRAERPKAPPATTMAAPASGTDAGTAPTDLRRLEDIARHLAGDPNAVGREDRAVPPTGTPPRAAGLPKPRPLPPISNPLRRREPISPVRSEDELMDFLSSMAAGGAH